MTAPVLESERLKLREWRKEDLAPLAAYSADEVTVRFFGAPGGTDDVWRHMAFLAGHWVLRGYGMWALEEKSSGRWIGYCGLWYPHGWPEREIAWGLAAAARGRGLATEAARRARGFAYDQLGWTTLISCIVPENIASRRVAERLGATPEGLIELKGHTTGVYRHPGPDRPSDLSNQPTCQRRQADRGEQHVR
jgi:RimJ/RimL family protein N-acetyltransferase